MTGQGNVHEHAPFPDAERSGRTPGTGEADLDICMHPTTDLGFIQGTRAPPTDDAGDQGRSAPSTPAVPTGDALASPALEPGSAAAGPRVVEGVMLRPAPLEFEPYVLPANGTLLFVFGNGPVFRRVLAYMILSGALVMVVVIVIMIAGVRFHIEKEVIIAGITSAVTMIGMAIRMIFHHRNGAKQAPVSGEEPRDAAST